jgi:DNA-binding transcriptional LysR family regulator
LPVRGRHRAGRGQPAAGPEPETDDDSHHHSTTSAHHHAEIKPSGIRVPGGHAERTARPATHRERLSQTSFRITPTGHRLPGQRPQQTSAVSRRGHAHAPLDQVLASRGLTRRVIAVVPTYTAAAQVIASSELTGLITASYASQVAALTGALVYEIPADLPTLPIAQAWHVRHDLDPAHYWLRHQVADVIGAAG